jgi:hypothetical protein
MVLLGVGERMSGNGFPLTLPSPSRGEGIRKGFL